MGDFTPKLHYLCKHERARAHSAHTHVLSTNKVNNLDAEKQICMYKQLTYLYIQNN